jgi:hypothetical protein
LFFGILLTELPHCTLVKNSKNTSKLGQNWTKNCRKLVERWSKEVKVIENCQNLDKKFVKNRLEVVKTGQV